MNYEKFGLSLEIFIWKKFLVFWRIVSNFLEFSIIVNKINLYYYEYVFG